MAVALSIIGYIAVGQLGTYRLDTTGFKGYTGGDVHFVRGYYFRIVDKSGDVVFIGAGGEQYVSDDQVQSNTISYGSRTIDFP